MWDYIKQYKPKLLSAPSFEDSSRVGKHEWVERELYGVPLLLRSAKHKKDFAGPKNVLIDDRLDNIQGWRNAGGIGISFTKVRSKGTYIAGTNGTSNGIIPFLKIFNETARAVDQGGGKRKGSIAIYMEPWHGDIMEFLDLRKNQGKDEIRARDLFLAMWMNDLFMERVELDENWTLMCPHECSGLTETYGQEFKDLYTKYENMGKGKRTLKAREVWNKILESQIETGTPYILYKDSINEKSNQKNIGLIKSSNLCAEIVEATGITKIQKEVLENKELLEIAKMFADYGMCQMYDEFGTCIHIDGVCEWHEAEHMWESFCFARGI